MQYDTREVYFTLGYAASRPSGLGIYLFIHYIYYPWDAPLLTCIPCAGNEDRDCQHAGLDAFSMGCPGPPMGSMPKRLNS